MDGQLGSSAISSLLGCRQLAMFVSLSPEIGGFPVIPILNACISYLVFIKPEKDVHLPCFYAKISSNGCVEKFSTEVILE